MGLLFHHWKNLFKNLQNQLCDLFSLSDFWEWSLWWSLGWRVACRLSASVKGYVCLLWGRPFNTTTDGSTDIASAVCAIDALDWRRAAWYLVHISTVAFVSCTEDGKLLCRLTTRAKKATWLSQKASMFRSEVCTSSSALYREVSGDSGYGKEASGL